LSNPLEMRSFRENLVQSAKKAVSKLELTETQFERTVRDKIADKTHLEGKIYYFKHIFVAY